MTGTPPPPRRGRLAVIALLLAMAAVVTGVLLKMRTDAGPEPAPVAGTPPADTQPIAFYLARGDAARGEAYFRARCGYCHTAVRDGPHGVGPNLWGAMGGPLASRPGYTSSRALHEHGGTWDWETTNRFLEQPRGFAPGTRMTFAGVLNPQDRADVMLWLNRQGGTLAAPENAR